jgi:hypothetical protein
MFSASSASFASSNKRRGLLLDSLIFASGMSCIEETTGGAVFVPLATIVAFISILLLFSESCGPSILRGAKLWLLSGPLP